MRYIRHLKQKGLTLIQLLSIIAILGIVATVAVSSYLKHSHSTSAKQTVNDQQA